MLKELWLLQITSLMYNTLGKNENTVRILAVKETWLYILYPVHIIRSNKNFGGKLSAALMYNLDSKTLSLVWIPVLSRRLASEFNTNVVFIVRIPSLASGWCAENETQPRLLWTSHGSQSSGFVLSLFLPQPHARIPPLSHPLSPACLPVLVNNNVRGMEK